MITFDDFKKTEIAIGKILSAEKVPDTDKLLKLSVSFGGEGSELGIRQIISGIAMHYPDPAVLVGTKCAFVTNLEPRVIKTYESQGMILAVSTAPDSPEGQKFSLLTVSEDIPEGTKVK